ncbi:MAG: hypothetical protein AABW50_04525 [Nanoarchaeota archaeon]
MNLEKTAKNELTMAQEAFLSFFPGAYFIHRKREGLNYSDAFENELFKLCLYATPPLFIIASLSKSTH